MKKLILLTLIICTSCLGSKTLSEKSHDKSTTEKSAVKSDSVANTTVNKGIDDNAVFKVPESKTGDLDIDRRINEGVANVLRSINFQKSSGDNSYMIRFNEKLNQLEAQIKLGETRNSEVATNNEAISEKAQTETTDESYKKYVKMIPLWLWIVAGIWFFPQILDRVKMIVNPIFGLLKRK